MVQRERAGGLVSSVSSVSRDDLIRRKRRENTEKEYRRKQQTKAAREARRKCSDAPTQKARLHEAVKQSAVDRKEFTKMWNDGVPVAQIGKRFGFSTYYVKQTAERFGLPQREVVTMTKETHGDRRCEDCVCYPCFQGIENFDTNFALTCKGYREKKQGV